MRRDLRAFTARETGIIGNVTATTAIAILKQRIVSPFACTGMTKGWHVAVRGCFNVGMQSPTKQFIAAIVTTLIWIAGLPDVPGQAGVFYTAAEAARHVGENATITDKIDSVHQSGKGNTFLNMGGRYPNQAFTAFIPAGSAAQFSEIQRYQGQTVAVTGKITLYRGKPEIVVTSPSQISAK